MYAAIFVHYIWLCSRVIKHIVQEKYRNIITDLWMELFSNFTQNQSQVENRICRQNPDLHANIGIIERRKHRGYSQSCTYAL